MKLTLCNIEGTNSFMIGQGDDGSDIIADVRPDRIKEAHTMVDMFNLAEKLKSDYNAAKNADEEIEALDAFADAFNRGVKE